MATAPRPYERRISSEEAREGYILVLKNRLALFPAVGKDFVLVVGGAALRARVEARHCECRGPAEPHEHYFIRRPGLIRGQRVVLQPVADGFELITT
jgi:hypothetical protein